MARALRFRTVIAHVTQRLGRGQGGCGPHQEDAVMGDGVHVPLRALLGFHGAAWRRVESDVWSSSVPASPFSHATLLSIPALSSAFLGSWNSTGELGRNRWFSARLWRPPFHG